MRAAVCPRYGPPEVLEVREVRKPTPAPNELLVRVRAVDVTVTDSRMRSGVPTAPLWFRAAMRISVGFRGPRRRILGFALSGTVEEIGRDVTGFDVGDRVYAFNGMRLGGFAEHACVRAHKIVARVPAGLSIDDAAAIPYGGLLAYCFMRKAPVRPGDDVLVYGASGATGVAAVQIARARGARVTAVCSGRNAELVSALGADAVIDYTTERSVGSRRFALVFGPAGKSKTSPLKESLAGALALGGRSVSVDGGLAFGLDRRALLELSRLVEAGQLAPVVDRRYPLEQIVDAFRYVEERHKRGSVLVMV
jgi:NADPH:quinone reductase-like Zn-dependent oxidoreductase